MWAVFDNLSATLALSIILLVIIQVQTDIAKSHVDQTAYTAMKSNAVEFSSWLERDFMQAGSEAEGIYTGDPVAMDTTNGTVTSFTLQHRPRMGETTGHRVSYTVTMNSDSTYTLNRYESGVQTGKSPNLSFIQIQFRDDNFQTVKNPVADWGRVENIFYRYEIDPMYEAYAGLPLYYSKAVMLNQ